MDIRVKKTKRSIANAFLELRAKLPLEKIRVNELCEKAWINKSTFYAHYHDIYELSEELEEPVIQSYLNIPHPEYVMTHSIEFVKELSQAYHANERLLNILFSDNRSGLMVVKIAEGIRQMVSRQYPQYCDDPVFDVVLTYRIYGGCYAFQEGQKYGEEKVIEILGKFAGDQSIFSEYFPD